MSDTSPSPSFERVAVLYHPKIEATHPVAEDINNWLSARGIDVEQAFTWDEAQVRPLMSELDLAIVLGGDGSMLRAARMAAGDRVPLLGLNMGRVGFLTEVTPTNWQRKLPCVLEGDYWVEERMMLQAEAWREDDMLGQYMALNDVVVSRGNLARVVQLRTEIDGDELTTYVADGLIISTPTGSTAYALAVGGPILPPELRNFLVIPIAPHLTLDRAIVLAQGSKVCVHVHTDHEAILTVDGQFTIEMQNGDHVEIHASDHVSRFIRLGKRSYFYHMLLERLTPKQPNESER